MSSTPFGVPVVPEVYIRSAGAFSSSGSSSKPSGASGKSREASTSIVSMAILRDISGKASASCADCAGEREQDLAVAMIERIGEAGARASEVQRRHHEAADHGAEEKRGGLIAVRHQERDLVAGAQSARLQLGRERSRLAQQAAVAENPARLLRMVRRDEEGCGALRGRMRDSDVAQASRFSARRFSATIPSRPSPAPRSRSFIVLRLAASLQPAPARAFPKRVRCARNIRRKSRPRPARAPGSRARCA